LNDLPATLAAALLELQHGNGQYAPGALGFNLADVSSLVNLNRPPGGVKGLVYRKVGGRLQE
jgi:hypothetical protein